ncbi:MAG: VIT domain-containing protein [Phycisphaerales bacterium]
MTSTPARPSVTAILAILVLIFAGVHEPAVASGVLVPSGSDSKAIRIVDHLVDATIDRGVAITKVEQVFENTTNGRLEATYIFPIPEGADLTGFKMSFNGKMVEGEVLPADKARQIYEDIVRRQRDPGLIEFIGRRLLRARIFPIEPHSKTTIELEYQQIVEPVSGMARYRYPLRTPCEDSYAYGTVRFDVTVKTDAPLKTVWSPTHTAEVVRNGEHEARVVFEAAGARLDTDFALLYDTDEQDIGLSLIANRPDEAEPGHFVLILSPKALWDEGESTPQDYVFVVDTSGSMAREGKLEQAREALGYCIDRLENEDRFSIVRFSTGYDLLFDSLRFADMESKQAARDMIDNFKATGGTNIHDALQSAIGLREEGTERPFVVVFLTDGQGDQAREVVEEMLAKETAGFANRVRLFPFGVGHDVNTKLLDALATGYQGAPTYVQPGENLEYALGDFFAIFSEPALTDLKLTLPDAIITEKFPPSPGDLYHGRQLVIAGQFEKPVTGAVRLTGSRGGERVQYVWDAVSFEPASEAWYVSRLWAGRKVAYLLDRIRLTGESPELVDEVVALASEYGIQTPYSSWLVAPEIEARAGIRLGRGGGEGRAPFDRGPAPASRRLQDRVEDLASPGLGGEGGPRNHEGGVFFGESASPEITQADRDELREVELLMLGAAEESGEDAVTVAAKMARARYANAADVGRLNARLLAVRTIDDRSFHNIRGVLVDDAFGAAEKAPDTLAIKFGSDAYFDVVGIRPDLRKALASGRSIIVMVTDNLALIVHPESGAEELTDAQREVVRTGLAATKESDRDSDG